MNVLRIQYNNMVIPLMDQQIVGLKKLIVGDTVYIEWIPRRSKACYTPRLPLAQPHAQLARGTSCTMCTPSYYCYRAGYCVRCGYVE